MPLQAAESTTPPVTPAEKQATISAFPHSIPRKSGAWSKDNADLVAFHIAKDTVLIIVYNEHRVLIQLSSMHFKVVYKRSSDNVLLKKRLSYIF